ncbi:helix-turn-helix transcriptional regulator [Ferrimonas kyonanensis]|uniref:helix-turn-helix transcriptional regulator n=1 Tax=Ferrimonas kyonanensis TaxID=364763 RepID=UPI00040867EE|nr:LuxR C-terminal-related transcriptional regulator [Ferrimonas kyonanensis]
MASELSTLVSQRIIDDFTSQLNQWGLDRFYYTLLPSLTPKGLRLNDCDQALDWKRVFSLKRMRSAVASDSDILKYRDEFIRRYAVRDFSLARADGSSLKLGVPVLWSDEWVSSRRIAGFKQLKQRHSIQTRMVFFTAVDTRPDIIGLCMLFSSLPEEDVLARINNQTQGLSELLTEYSAIFNALTFRSINPLINFGVLSPTCAKILALVADGYSSEEIGRQLHITERGVNYHLDRARQIMVARNRTNLVSKAYQHGVL